MGQMHVVGADGNRAWQLFFDTDARFMRVRQPASFHVASIFASVGCTGASWVTLVFVAFTSLCFESQDNDDTMRPSGSSSGS